MLLGYKEMHVSQEEVQRVLYFLFSFWCNFAELGGLEVIPKLVNICLLDLLGIVYACL